MQKIIFILIMSFFFSCSENELTNNKFKDLISNNNPTTIVLKSSCPPGFELNQKNECINRNLYQQYKSLEDVGVGGLKTALPKVRDGFSPQQIDLGRYLFFDPILSLDSSISCASCHQPNKGFSDGLAFSTGIKGRKVSRSAPSLWNVAFLNKFFWDGHSKSLEEQMQGPLYSINEMGTNPKLLLYTINNIPEYQRLFLEAFPDKKQKKISLNEIYNASDCLKT